MKRYLLYIVLTVVLSTAGCTRGQWLDEVVAQRDEQEEVVPILRAAKEKGLTVDSAEEIERTNKYYTVDTANGYYNEFKRYRLVFSDKTTVEFDVLGQLNGVKSDYYEKRGVAYISSIDLVDVVGGLYIWIAQSDGMGGGLSFQYTTPNNGGNTPENNKIYYTSTDGGIVTPNDTTVFGANIFSNTYENGQGVITFDGKVMEIGGQAFYNCSSLTSITIPDSVTYIGYDAFHNCDALTSITIPDSVTSIGGQAFYGCSSLVSITIPDSVTSIGYMAFAYCSSLTSITIPDSVISIGSSAFEGCSSLASVTIPDSVTSIGDCAFIGCSSLASINIPNSVTSIGIQVFYECSNLASITIPDGVTSIGYTAFYGCSSLAEVYCKAITPPTAIPYSFYGWGAFDSNASGRKIYVPTESVEAYKTAEWWSEYADAFVPYDFLKNRKIYYTSTDGNVVTPYATDVFGANIISNTYENGQGVITFDGNVTEIGYQAFYQCSSLASITIPDGVISIGDWAFYACLSLASIAIPEGVTEIGFTSFAGSKLTSITIPNSVTSIGDQAFYGCSSLVSTTIPDSVTSIGYAAFRYCHNLAEVYCKSAMPPTAVPSTSSSPYWDAFDDNASGRKIYVPTKSVGAYKSANYWSDYADDFVAYDFEKGEVVNLESRKIYYTSTNGNVVTPDATNGFGANIVSNTYENGKGVITFDGEVTKIGANAFLDCSSLASITIPDSVTSIGYQAFWNCSSLVSITIPDSVTSIRFAAFRYCRKLAEVYCKSSMPPTAAPSTSSSPYWRAFDDNASERKIYVPEESVEAYKTAEWWSEYADAIEPYVFE